MSKILKKIYTLLKWWGIRMSRFKVTENSSDNLEKKALKLISTIEEKLADARVC